MSDDANHLAAHQTFRRQPVDLVDTSVRAAISALPVVGGPLVEFYTFVVGDPAQKRRDEFLRSVHERIEELENDGNAALTPASLRENPAFQATCIQAVQTALRTAQREKLDLLRNAILNAALAPELDESVRQTFVSYIDRLSVMHVAILNFLDNPMANPKAATRLANMTMGGLKILLLAAFPQLQGNDAWAGALVAELEAMHLVSGASLNMTMSGEGLKAGRTTPLGKSFLSFLSDPETGKVPV